MKKLAILLAVAFVGTLVPAACGAGNTGGDEDAEVKTWTFAETPTKMEPYRERAGNAFARLGSKLLPRLQQAINEGGPESGIEVCKNVALEMTDKVANEEGFEMGRTSHKLRNPDNAPREWIKTLVEESGGRKGNDVEGRVFDLGDRVGVASPIVTIELCLQCHGNDEQVSEATRQAIRREYPEDKARGFTLGEVRGWFWAEVPKD